MIHPTYKIVLDLISKDNAGKINILDYGCGSGLLLDYLPSRLIDSYIGCDINHDSLEIARTRYFRKNISFVHLKTSKSKLSIRPGSLDVIILVGVLQYLKSSEIDYLLRTLKPLLKKDGCLVAAVAVKHNIYRFLDIYQLLLPHNLISRRKLLISFKKNNWQVDRIFERGLLFAPVFANICVVFFDILDKVIFRTKGSLGPIGIYARKAVNPLIHLEYSLPLDYGYTLFIKATRI